MSTSGVGAAVALALIQGALVALPKGNALESLRRLRSPAWAVVLPGCIVVGTFAPLAAQSFALGMILLAALATPPLAVVAVLAVARGPRAAIVALAFAAGVLAMLVGGWSGQVAATVLTALGALAVGASLARLIPARWVLVGVMCMCAVDVFLLAVGVGQPASLIIAHAAARVRAPLFNHAQIGRVFLDYPDLVLAAALGGFFAGDRGQPRAALLVCLLAAGLIILTPRGSMWPATIPVALTLVALRTPRLVRGLRRRPLAPQPATP